MLKIKKNNEYSWKKKKLKKMTRYDTSHYLMNKIIKTMVKDKRKLNLWHSINLSNAYAITICGHIKVGVELIY